MRNTFQSAISTAMACVLFSFPIGCSKRPSDETITEGIQTKVAADPDTKDSHVTVASKDGKVTLTGTARTGRPTKAGSHCPSRARNRRR
jgi:osmotically-inducible protein OsmY